MPPHHENDLLNGLLSHFLVKNLQYVMEREAKKTPISTLGRQELQRLTSQISIQRQMAVNFHQICPQKHVGDCKQQVEGGLLGAKNGTCDHQTR